VAVDVGHPERSDDVAQTRQRARHQRAAAAEHQRSPAVRHDVAHGRAHRPRRRQRVRDADHAGGRIALVTVDPHVEVAPVQGAEPRRQVVLAHRRGSVLGPAGTADGVDGHADRGPRD
jgi:hypothetical protein